jgi:L-asparaginase
MLEGLCKPVVLTGSQLPIGMLRTDGKENLITAIEIASARDEQGRPLVPEVCIFFENCLLRGNRTTKINAENFDAFRSYNYPPLAVAGINIKYDRDKIAKVDFSQPLKPHFNLDTNVIVLTLFPGIQENVISNLFRTAGLKAVVLKTFGAGNAPQQPWFIELLKRAIADGIIIVNISQCLAGMVQMKLYELGKFMTAEDVQMLNPGTMDEITLRAIAAFSIDAVAARRSPRRPRTCRRCPSRRRRGGCPVFCGDSSGPRQSPCPPDG